MESSGECHWRVTPGVLGCGDPSSEEMSHWSQSDPSSAEEIDFESVDRAESCSCDREDLGVRFQCTTIIEWLLLLLLLLLLLKLKLSTFPTFCVVFVSKIR